MKRVVKRVLKGEGFLEEWRLLHTAYKVYTVVSTERLKKISRVKRDSPRESGRFLKVQKNNRKYYYIFSYAVEKKLEKKGGEVYAFFVDSKAAFPSVDRKKLWKVMGKREKKIGLIERERESE